MLGSRALGYREAHAYLVGGLTEFWRAHRAYAGVQHFVYLTASHWTADNFLDPEQLEIEPRWFEYAKNAFAPSIGHQPLEADDFGGSDDSGVDVRARTTP